MSKKDKKEVPKKNKIIGGFLLIGVVILVIIYAIFNVSSSSQKENEALNKTVEGLQKDNEKKDNLINRLDKKNVNKEEENVRNKAKMFVELLYQTEPEMNDEKRYEEAKKVVSKDLMDKYFGKNRKSPIKYQTDVKNLHVYTERYSPKKTDYHVYITLDQIIKDPDGEISESRQIASELTLKQKNSEWLVESFEQFDEQDTEHEKE